MFDKSFSSSDMGNINKHSPLNRKGVIKGNIVEDVNRLFEVLSVSSMEEFLSNIEHNQYR